MRKYFLFILVFLVSFSPVKAGNFFIRGGGILLFDESYMASLGPSLAVGYRLGDEFSILISGDYVPFNWNVGISSYPLWEREDVLTLGLNGQREIPLFKAFSINLTAGLIEVFEYDQFPGDSYALGGRYTYLQLGIGTKYQLANDLSLCLEWDTRWWSLSYEPVFIGIQPGLEISL